MRHIHTYKVSARTHFDLGYKIGVLFKSPSLNTYHAILKQVPLGSKILTQAQAYLKTTEQYFPQYIQELKGYAHALKVSFNSFWITFLYEELEIYPERCTTLITNGGMLMGHNEDFNAHYEKRICILEKKIQDSTIKELYYYNGLGGTSFSVNSHGYAQTINTVTHMDERIGVPRNIIGRWLSETRNPDADFEQLKTISRSLGYSHCITSRNGSIWNIESTANDAVLLKPTAPFVHTNHYLSRLSSAEPAIQSPTGNTHERYRESVQRLAPDMNLGAVETLLISLSSLRSVNMAESMTIARAILDWKQMRVYFWLRRESDRGLISYSL